MPTIAEVTEYLERHGIPVRTFVEPTPTAATAALAVGCTEAEIAKTLLFFVGKQPVAVVASGDVRVKGGELKRCLGWSGQVRLPQGEEVLALTGYAPGGVCPFLLPPELPVVVDDSLRRFAVVYAAAGDDHSAVPIHADRLLELTGGRAARVCG
jgi:prolyl-tRNA editing enzyme YbaK/EbsC (Cys-tRNA(Pro) deacylase)